MFYRASFDSLVTPSKRKAQTEGEDTEEDVQEQKVSVIISWHSESTCVKESLLSIACNDNN